MAMTGTVAFTHNGVAIDVDVRPAWGWAASILATMLVLPAFVLFPLGLVRARLLVGREEVDHTSWSWRPRRRLIAKIGDDVVEAEVDTQARRTVRLFVNGRFERSLSLA